MTDEWQGILSETEDHEASQISQAQVSQDASGTRTRNPTTPPPVSAGGLLTPGSEAKHLRFADDGSIAEETIPKRNLFPLNRGLGYRN